MGKRSNFQRIERDFYPTPMQAVLPLLPHLTDNFFIEPCAGNGSLINHLEASGLHCISASDIEPQRADICKINALDILHYKAQIITNPPWDRKILHPMIDYFSNMVPTWLLFDADWVHTKQARQFSNRLRKIVSVGRVQWIEGSGMTGKDNCAWHLFDKPNFNLKTEFFMRVI